MRAPSALRDRERGGRDAAADAPDEHPLAGLEAAFVTSIRYAVSKTSGNAAASSKESPSGIGWALRGTAINSACVPSQCSPSTWMPSVCEVRVDHDPLVAAGDHPGAVGSEDARLRHRGQAFPDPEVEVIERRGAQLDEHLARPGLRIRRILVAEDLRPALLVDADRLHPGSPSLASCTGALLRGMRCKNNEPVRRPLTGRWHCHNAQVATTSVSTATVQTSRGRARPRRGRGRRAEAYVETERHIRERRARGLFGRLRFTIAQPEVSCHPEKLLDGARSVISAALCYYAPEPERPDGHGRLPRYAWHDGYAELREKLDALGPLARRAYRVLVDANQHVDREAAARSGVGFYGKNTMLITRRHGSWVVLGTLVTAAELEPTPATRRRLRHLHALYRRLPDGRAGRSRSSTRRSASPTGRRCRSPIPEPYRAPLEAQVYGCDICQDVCPGTAASSGAAPGCPPIQRLTSTSSRGSPATSSSRPGRSSGSTCRGTIRAGCAGTRSSRSATQGRAIRGRARTLRRYADGDDELLAEHARWALARLEERCS